VLAQVAALEQSQRINHAKAPRGSRRDRVHDGGPRQRPGATRV